MAAPTILSRIAKFLTSPAGIGLLAVVGIAAANKAGILKNIKITPKDKMDTSGVGKGARHLRNMFKAASDALSDAKKSLAALRGGQFNEFKAEFDRRLDLVDKLEISKKMVKKAEDATKKDERVARTEEKVEGDIAERDEE